MRSTVTFQKILLAFFAFIGLLILARFYFTGKLQFLFLVWNIFLAWIPFMVSSLFDKMTGKSSWKQLLVCFCWLVFFPNALYIVTDLIHLETTTRVPKWFDVVLLFSASVVGLLMAFISLHRAERYLQKTVKLKWQAPITVLILFLGSFGVYLGRFLRWNSWDIISNPLELLSTIIQRLIFPLDHLYTWGITSLLTVLFYLLYLSVKKLPGYLSQAGQASGRL